LLTDLIGVKLVKLILRRSLIVLWDRIDRISKLLLRNMDGPETFKID